MSRALIYARFSSDDQSEQSANDQLQACEAVAKSRGWVVAGLWKDEAISGAIFARPGLQALLEAARKGQGDIIMAESLSRFSRDLGDMAGIRRTIEAAGAKLFTLAEGECSLIHVGLLGVMNEKYLADLAEMTRRGMHARAADGRVVGGRRYGYKSKPETLRGVEIDSAEADIVVEIYERYLAGESPRAICEDLNKRKIPGPTGGLWRPNTINGDRKRKVGILENPIYGGKIVFGRTRMKRDADTRKRIHDLRSEDAWTIIEAPELAIVPSELFAAVRARKEARGGERPEKARRRKRLFSGMVKCAECGENYIIKTKEMMCCRGEADLKICRNTRRIFYNEVEEAALKGIREQMLRPEAVSAFKDEFTRALKEQQSGAPARLKKAQRAKTDSVNAIEKLLDLVQTGGMTDMASARSRLGELERQKREAIAELEDIEKSTKVMAIHPSIPEAYERALASLGNILDGAAGAEGQEARNLIHELIDEIVAHAPREEAEPVRLEIKARSERIAEEILGEHYENHRTLTVVAGGGIEPPTSGL